MLGFTKMIRILIFSLAVGPVAFADDSRVKTELKPTTLELEIVFFTDTIDEITRNLDKQKQDQVHVRQLSKKTDPEIENFENTWVFSVSLPGACDFLDDLNDDNSEFSKGIEVLDQISFNDLTAGTSYCNRHSLLQQGTVNYIKDYVSQHSWADLRLSTLGFAVDENVEGQCTLSNGEYTFEDKVGELNCLNYFGWYYIKVYDYVYRDMNEDGYLDLVLFTALNGSWSGPPKRSTLILTKTGSIEEWRLISQSASALAPGGSNEKSPSRELEISEFPALSTFETVNAFQKRIDEYVASCIDKTYGNTKAVPCFVGYELWDRELNRYYGMLLKRLPQKLKVQLRASQRRWLQDRDNTIEFNSALLDRHYEGVQGTMYVAMRASDSAGAISPMVRQRALLLKKWFEMEVQGPWRDLEK